MKPKILKSEKIRHVAALMIVTLVALALTLSSINTAVQHRKSNAFKKEFARLNIDVKRFHGQKLNFKSMSCEWFDRFDSKSVQTIKEPTYHFFDLWDMSISQQPTGDTGKTKKYFITGFREEKNYKLTKYVFIVGSDGLKEVWIKPGMNSISYIFDDGTRQAYHNLSREYFYSLVSLR